MQKRGHPPRALLAAIVGITVIPLAFLLWLGWRFLDQDRVLERQQAQDRLERSADLVAATVQRNVSASEQRLANGAADWPEGAVALTFHAGRMDAQPRSRIAYLPVAPAAPKRRPRRSPKGEALEFRQKDRAAAIRKFSELAAAPDPAVRAGALVRLARNLKALGRNDEALAAYQRMALLDTATVAGAPAALTARYARCKLLEEAGRRTELRIEAQKLADDLHTARWALTGPIYWLHAADADAWTGRAPATTRGGNVRQGGRSGRREMGAARRLRPRSPARRRSAGHRGLEPVGRIRPRLLAGAAFVERQWLDARRGNRRPAERPPGIRPRSGGRKATGRQRRVGIALDAFGMARHVRRRRRIRRSAAAY